MYLEFSAEANEYCKGLNRSDFNSDEDFLLERVKRGLAAGYTFLECYEHWQQDFKAALYEASNDHQKNVCDQGKKLSG